MTLKENFQDGEVLSAQSMNDTNHAVNALTANALGPILTIDASGNIHLDSPLPVAEGGTGAATLADGRANLGVPAARHITSGSIDDVMESGVYYVYNAVTDKPTPGGGLLLVAGGGTATATQLFVHNSANNKIYARPRYNSTWLNWFEYVPNSEPLGLGTSIPVNADLNNYTCAGVYYSGAKAISETLLNAPYNRTGFRLKVNCIMSEGQITQELVANSSTVDTFRRSGQSVDGIWTFYPWQKYTSTTVTT